MTQRRWRTRRNNKLQTTTRSLTDGLKIILQWTTTRRDGDRKNKTWRKPYIKLKLTYLMRRRLNLTWPVELMLQILMDVSGCDINKEDALVEEGKCVFLKYFSKQFNDGIGRIERNIITTYRSFDHIRVSFGPVSIGGRWHVVINSLRRFRTGAVASVTVILPGRRNGRS